MASDKTDEKSARRRWSKNEIEDVLSHLLETIQSGRNLEKPNANLYYQRALEKLKLEGCSVSQIKNKVKNLKKDYLEAVNWRSNTGQGVLESEGEQVFKNYMLKKYPHFEQLDEIFGSRGSVTPPFVHDTANREAVSVIDSEEVEIESHQLGSNLPIAVTSGTTKTIDKQQTENGHDNSIGCENVSKKGSKRKHPPTSGVDALAMSAQFRMEVQNAEIQLKREKWQDEKIQREKSENSEWEKFEFEKQIALRKIELEEKKVQNEFELEKYRVDQEMKLKLELAKLQNK